MDTDYLTPKFLSIMMCKLINNPIRGIKSFPILSKGLVFLIISYFISTLFIGLFSGLFSLNIIPSHLMIFLPVILLLYPSFIEECIFRGILIPYDINIYRLWQRIIYVAWHPLNALLYNKDAIPKDAIPIFLNQYFLIITALLGITCGIAYIISRSLWVPVFIHWTTVFVWVGFFNGRNEVVKYFNR